MLSEWLSQANMILCAGFILWGKRKGLWEVTYRPPSWQSSWPIYISTENKVKDCFPLLLSLCLNSSTCVGILMVANRRTAARARKEMGEKMWVFSPPCNCILRWRTDTQSATWQSLPFLSPMFLGSGPHFCWVKTVLHYYSELLYSSAGIIYIKLGSYFWELWVRKELSWMMEWRAITGLICNLY